MPRVFFSSLASQQQGVRLAAGDSRPRATVPFFLKLFQPQSFYTEHKSCVQSANNKNISSLEACL